MSYNLIANIISSVTGGLFNFTRVVTAEDKLLISPASILAAYIRSEETMSDPDDDDDWPLYISYLPDEVKTNAGAIYNTQGVKDGRLMEGSVIQYHGIQIKIRSDAHDTGWAKIEDISNDLDLINREEIKVDSEDYLIHNVNRIGSIISLGTEPGTKKRQLFTINFLVTLSRVV